MNTNAIEHCERLIRERMRVVAPRPLVIAIDGGAGAGKSTFAAGLAERLAAVVLTLDDFFTTRVAEWELRHFPVEQRWSHWFEWDRVRLEALVPLLNRKAAVFKVFDFLGERDERDRWCYHTEPKRIEPADVIVLEGSTSGQPAIADLIDVAVLLQVDPAERLHRRFGRGDGEYNDMDAWHQVHAQAEAHYLNQVSPPTRFDVIYDNGSAS